MEIQHKFEISHMYVLTEGNVCQVGGTATANALSHPQEASVARRHRAVWKGWENVVSCIMS